MSMTRIIKEVRNPLSPRGITPSPTSPKDKCYPFYFIDKPSEKRIYQAKNDVVFDGNCGPHAINMALNITNEETSSLDRVHNLADTREVIKNLLTLLLDLKNETRIPQKKILLEILFNIENLGHATALASMKRFLQNHATSSMVPRCLLHFMTDFQTLLPEEVEKISNIVCKYFGSILERQEKVASGIYASHLDAGTDKNYLDQYDLHLCMLYYGYTCIDVKSTCMYGTGDSMFHYMNVHGKEKYIGHLYGNHFICFEERTSNLA